MNVKEQISKYVYVDEGDKRLARVFLFMSVVLIIKVAIFSIKNAGVDF